MTVRIMQQKRGRRVASLGRSPLECTVNSDSTPPTGAAANRSPIICAEILAFIRSVYAGHPGRIDR